MFRVIMLVMTMFFAQGADATKIEYEVNNIAGNTWEYTYTVTNDTLGMDLEEFTVFFDPALYENLASPVAPATWDPLIVQPNPAIPDDGFYDALAQVSGILPGDTLAGFSLQFDFLGSGTPGDQPFDIVDPVTFVVLDSGTTEATQLDEPSSYALQIAFPLVMGLVAFARRRETRPSN